MNHKKGQALVEFIIILPLVIYIILAVIDFCVIVYNKNIIENKVDDIIEIYKTNQDVEKINKYLNSDMKNVTFKVKEKDNYLIFRIEKKYDVITPGLNLIIGSPYIVSTERVTLNE